MNIFCKQICIKTMNYVCFLHKNLCCSLLGCKVPVQMVNTYFTQTFWSNICSLMHFLLLTRITLICKEKWQTCYNHSSNKRLLSLTQLIKIKGKKRNLFLLIWMYDKLNRINEFKELSVNWLSVLKFKITRYECKKKYTF